MKFQKRERLVLVIPILCFFLYAIRFEAGHIRIDRGTQLNYFRFQADAFLHCRLNLENTPSKEDLVEYKGKFYMYWPPVPALVFMPLVALFGLDLPDALINALFGAFNVLLVLLIFIKCNSKFNLNLNPISLALLGLFWGLGTVQFYMAMKGSVWFISQIMAQTFLLASILVFLRGKAKIFNLFLSGFLLACAIYTRNHFVFVFPFFVALFFALERNTGRVENLKSLIYFCIPFVIFSGLNAIYNFVRFGDVFENGLKYHIMSAYFQDNFNQHGYFSLHYFSHNFYTEVLHWPSFKESFPFIKKEPEGFGFIWGSPLFLLLIPNLYFYFSKLRKSFWDPHFQLMSACLLSAFGMAMVIFCIMGTGWVQFCARYTLDFQFFLLLFMVLALQNYFKHFWVKIASVVLITLSFSIQLIGAYFLN